MCSFVRRCEMWDGIACLRLFERRQRRNQQRRSQNLSSMDILYRSCFCTFSSYGIFVDMYIDGIGNETTRKMRLYSMYVISFQIKGKGIYKGKLSIELDEKV